MLISKSHIFVPEVYNLLAAVVSWLECRTLAQLILAPLLTGQGVSCMGGDPAINKVGNACEEMYESLCVEDEQ